MLSSLIHLLITWASLVQEAHLARLMVNCAVGMALSIKVGKILLDKLMPSYLELVSFEEQNFINKVQRGTAPLQNGLLGKPAIHKIMQKRLIVTLPKF